MTKNEFAQFFLRHGVLFIIQCFEIIGWLIDRKTIWLCGDLV